MRVDGIGPIPCDWFICGEAPGYEEDKRGEPFVGKTGNEMFRFFDGDSLPPFDECFRTNLYRFYKGKDAIYDAEDFARDEPYLLDELRRVQPKVIVAVGRHSSRYFMGDVSMDQVHGLPWFLPPDSKAGQVLLRQETANDNKVVVLCCYHPAAGFRSPEASALVSYDFAELARFAAGTLHPRTLYDDPYPRPQYFHVTDHRVVEDFAVGASTRNVSVDTEGWARNPWSLQWSRNPGTGYLVQAKHTQVVDAFLTWITTQRVPLTYHNSLHDRSLLRAFARLCGWGEERILFELDTLPFGDTMVMAYLLQLEAQGLKPLATRHANMSMSSYDEVLGGAQSQLALSHLQSMWDCLNFDYEEQQQEEFARINRTPLLDAQGQPKRTKDGSVRYRKTTVLPSLPKSDLFKAVERCMRAKDPHKLYHDQVLDVQDSGYRLLGAMPEATLSHVDFPTALTYGCRDADATTRIEPEMSSRIDAMGLREVYNLELSTYPLIDRMMQVGMKPNLAVFKALSAKLSIEIADIQVRLEQATGREGFNANSGDQVAELLFNRLNLAPIKMTSGGDRYSTNDKILEALEKEHGHDHPVISDVRDYREVYKLKSTFVDRVPDFVHRYPHDGRVHATFRTTRVITGRLAASDPNILAQPERGTFAKDFKAGWEAEAGHALYSADLSQIELRIMAHLSQDPVLMEAYCFECPHKNTWQSGKSFCDRDTCILRGDLHARLAHQTFGVLPTQQEDGKHRVPAKVMNFGGLCMGMTCHGLMIELRKNGINVDEEGAQEWIDAANKLYVRVPHYKDEKIAEARRNGYIRCLDGRVRYIGGIHSRDERLRAEAERFAFSTPVQAGAQTIMKQAEAYLWQHILMPYYKQGFYKGGSRKQWVEPLVQVHDALRLEFPLGMEQELHEKMVYAMTKVPTQLRVPLGVEGKWGLNLRDMRKYT